MDHPSAQEGIAGDFTIQQILDSEVIAWPVHRLMVSPVSDGAGALVLASDDFARRVTDSPIWVEGVGWCLDTSYWTNRDLYYPRYVERAARMAYEMAGIKEPRQEIHIVEPYDPFAYKELHHLEGLLLAEKGEAPRLLERGFWDRDTETGIPSCPSGGLLGVGNPIAAAGIMKVAEIFWQLKGKAGKRQVRREVRRGLAQAWGDLMQVGTVVILGK
jgi:acetyl-CoA C-acetyltransferase